MYGLFALLRISSLSRPASFVVSRFVPSLQFLLGPATNMISIWISLFYKPHHSAFFSKETLAEFVGRLSFYMLFIYSIFVLLFFLLCRSFNVQLLFIFVVLNSTYTRTRTVSWGIFTYISTYLVKNTTPFLSYSRVSKNSIVSNKYDRTFSETYVVDVDDSHNNRWTTWQVEWLKWGAGRFYIQITIAKQYMF